MDPITITAVTSGAVAIAEAVGLADWLKRKFHGRPGAEAAATIVDIATRAVGASTPAEALERVSGSSEAAARVRRQLQQWEQELVRLDQQDRADARALYGRQHGVADRIARQIMVWNLPAVVALVAANCAAVYYIANPTVAVALGNLIGASIAHLWGERLQVVSFFFGSSLGSKDKQGLLAVRAARGRQA